MFKKESLRADYNGLPERPGVYMFIDGQGQILYVGKAKSIKDRVRSYPEPTTPKIQSLLELSEKIEFRTTNTELAAMMLEARLIQSHQPPFNVLLRGGKPFLYLILTKTNPPELLLTRQGDLPGKIIAHFLNKTEGRTLYSALLKNFQLRLCQKKIYGGCLYWHLGQCAGPCRKDFDEIAYLSRLDLATRVLRRGAKPLVAEIETKQAEASANLDFERARALEKQIKSLEQCDTILSDPATTENFFATAKTNQKDIWIAWPDSQGLELFMATGATVTRKELWLDPEDEPLAYLKEYYSTNSAPSAIFTNFTVSDRSTLQEFIREWQQIQSVVIFDKIGSNPSDILSLALLLSEANQRARKEVPLELAKLCGSQKPIQRIDCFDISHKSGMALVGACVRFKDGKLDPENLRLFKIKTVEGNDDYASLAEAVRRRYKDGGWPDLILIDGGKGQRNTVLPYTKKIPVAALAKREERLFCEKNFETGIKLKLIEPLGALLVALRDKTHKRAFLFHRSIFEKTNLN